MSKAINDEIKRKISKLCNNSGMSNFEIAKELGISPRSVRRYKDYKDPDQTRHDDQVLNESEISHQNIQNQIEDITETEIPEHKDETIGNDEDFPGSISYDYVEVKSCPECGSPKQDWMTIEQAFKDGYDIPEEYDQFYDYVCPKCKILIPEKRLDIDCKCPSCGSSPINWLPIERAKVSEEIKRVSDFICLECCNPIEISV